MMRRNVAFLGTAVVVVSAVVNVAHTASHAGLHLMPLPGWQLAYIAIVIYASPVVAASLLWTRHRFAGAWLLAASMAGSFAFGLLYHFVIPRPDNVFMQPPGTWRTAFGVSAALLLPLWGSGCLDHLRKAPPGFVVRRMRINGRLGLVGYFEDGSPHSVTTIDVAGDKVRAIRLVVNPEKLGGVPPLDRAEIVEGPR